MRMQDLCKMLKKWNQIFHVDTKKLENIQNIQDMISEYLHTPFLLFPSMSVLYIGVNVPKYNASICLIARSQ